jgi:hypothetical protein
MPAAQYWQVSGGNWGGPPPGTPPPHRFSDPSRPDLGYQPQPPKKRNTWPIIAGAAALVVVITLAAIGIWRLLHRDPVPHPVHHPTTTTSTTTTTTTTPANTAQSRLLSLLPEGYPSGTCTPKTPTPNGIYANALAEVTCGQNTNQGGPSGATYLLFADADALSKAFNDDTPVTGVDPMTCPGSGPSPQPWQHGMITCATYKNKTNLIWSNQDELLLGDVFGDPPDIEHLYQWWRSIS